MRRGGYVQILVGCGCAAIAGTILLLGMMTALNVFSLNNGGSLSSGIAFVSPEGLSDIVPPNYGSLFTEAGKATGVAPAMVAAIYMTEHHTDSFGADLPSLDYALSPCTENYAGAAGPMQFITSSWNGVVDDLQAYGISSPDRCKYRDSIIGAAFLLKGKLRYDWVQTACKTTDLTTLAYTDDCVSRWGQSYCGVDACRDKACSNVARGYFYCEEVVRKYKLAVSVT